MAIKQLNRSEEVEKSIADRLTDLAGPDGRLPTEAELASLYGVSRTTIRTAVGALVARGLVIRRQGMGSFVSKGGQIANPLDQVLDFCELIERNGCKPGIKYLSAEVHYPRLEIAQALQRPDELVVERHTIFTADDTPVIYCINTIPLWVLPGSLARELVANPEISEPIFGFLSERCHQHLEYRTGSMRPDLARNCHANELRCDPLTPVLVIDEVGYNLDGQPLLHSIEYYPGNFMNFQFVRRTGNQPTSKP